MAGSSVLLYLGIPGKYGAMIGGLGFPLKGGDFSSYEDAVIMVYSGQQTNTKC